MEVDPVVRVFRWPPVGGGVEAGGDVPAVVAAKLVARVMVTCSGSGGVVGCASRPGGGGRDGCPAWCSGRNLAESK
ncbi:hypothetical protein Tco_0622095 [Tanacetum coccineum]